MKRQISLRFAAALVILSLTAGCAAPFSKNLLQQADESATVDRVRANPDAFKDRFVLWGGMILSTQPHEKDTTIEVLQKPLDYMKRPKDADATRGRFFAKINGFLDPAVFCEGRDITVAGRIAGTDTADIGEYSYTYPVVNVEDYHLWSQQTEYRYPTYPIYPPYDPWWYY